MRSTHLTVFFTCARSLTLSPKFFVQRTPFSTPLKTLILYRNNIGPEGAKSLAAVLPRCDQLICSWSLSVLYHSLQLVQNFVPNGYLSVPC